jgi:hypothetical protein
LARRADLVPRLDEGAVVPVHRQQQILADNWAKGDKLVRNVRRADPLAPLRRPYLVMILSVRGPWTKVWDCAGAVDRLSEAR